MIVGVDHILVAIKDLDQAMEMYRRLGFQVLRGGEHSRMGTYNALVPLTDGSYLELIGVNDPTKAEQFPNTRLVVRALAQENRLATFALESTDLPHDITLLRSRGLDIGDPLEGERLRPDGQKVAWRTAHFRDPALPFLIEDITPHHVRVPVPNQGLGKHAWLANLELRAGSIQDTLPVWQDLLGQVPSDEDTLTLKRCRIHLEPDEGQPTGLSALSLAVDNYADAVHKLQTAGVRLSPREGAAILDPQAAAGAPIELLDSSHDRR